MSKGVAFVSMKEVQNTLNFWRQKKKSRFEPIPIHIRILIKQLSNRYSKSKIISTLNLSSTKFDDIVKLECADKTANNFLPFRLVSADEDTPPKPDTNNATFEISNASGAKLIIKSPDISNVIKAFLCSH